MLAAKAQAASMEADLFDEFAAEPEPEPEQDVLLSDS
jgi:hypothetical protein